MRAVGFLAQSTPDSLFVRLHGEFSLFVRLAPGAIAIRVVEADGATIEGTHSLDACGGATWTHGVLGGIGHAWRNVQGATGVVTDARVTEVDPNGRARVVVLHLDAKNLGYGTFEARATEIHVAHAQEAWELQRVGDGAFVARLYVGPRGVWGEPFAADARPAHAAGKIHESRRRELDAVARVLQDELQIHQIGSPCVPACGTERP